MTTGASEFIDSTTADVFIPEIWSQEVIVAREQRLVFASLVDRKYEKGLKYGDTVNIGSIGNLTAQSKAKSTNAAIVYETVTETQLQISIATWEYNGIATEKIVEVQAMIDLAAKYAPKQGYALDLAVDDVLAGLVDDFTTNVIGTLGVSLEYDDILEGSQALDDSNSPDDGRVIIASPAQITEWMKLDAFIHADYSSVHGGIGQPAGPAYTKSWLNMPVYKSTNVEGSNAAGHDNCMIHKSALALVMQMNPTSHSVFDIDYLCQKIVVEQLYGSKEIRDDHGCFLRGL